MKLNVGNTVEASGQDLLDLIRDHIQLELHSFTWDASGSTNEDFELDIDVSTSFQVSDTTDIDLDETIKMFNRIEDEIEVSRILLDNVSTENILSYLKGVRVLVPQKRTWLQKLKNLPHKWVVY